MHTENLGNPCSLWRRSSFGIRICCLNPCCSTSLISRHEKLARVFYQFSTLEPLRSPDLRKQRSERSYDLNDKVIQVNCGLQTFLLVEPYMKPDIKLQYRRVKGRCLPNRFQCAEIIATGDVSGLVAPAVKLSIFQLEIPPMV